MKKVLIGLLFGFVLLGGCYTHSSAQTEGEEADFSASAKSAVPSVAIDKPSSEVKQTVAKNPRQRRYRQASTQVTFLLLNIEDEVTHEQVKVIVDNNTWLGAASQLGIPGEPISAYKEYMAAHDQEVFLVPSELFAKLKGGTFAENAQLQKLSDEEILAKYFTEIGRSFVAKNSDDRTNRELIGNLLERNFDVFTDCESGALTVKP